MSRGPGWLFIAGLAVFALLGLLAGSPGRETPPGGDVSHATDALKSRVRLDAPREVGAARVQTVATRSARALARSWGQAWANWSAQTLSDQLASLIRSAGPALAAELRDAQAVATAAGRPSTEQTGSRGSVVAVRVAGADAARRVVVVTREAAYSSAGLDPAGYRYRVYVGLAVRGRSGEWTMAKWQRQP